MPVASRHAAVLLALGLMACGPGGPIPTGAETLQEALALGADVSDVASVSRRSLLYQEARAQSEAEARAELVDGPALFVVEREGRLFAMSLPSAQTLLLGANRDVDLESSAEAWPTEPRVGLKGESEKSLAARVGSALIMTAGLCEGPIVVERESGAPYAAAFVQGRLRLNPVLLYLASASEEPAEAVLFQQPREQATAPAACTTGPGAVLPASGILVLALLRRRRAG